MLARAMAAQERSIALALEYLRRRYPEQRKRLTVVSLDAPPRPRAGPSGQLVGSGSAFRPGDPRLIEPPANLSGAVGLARLRRDQGRHAEARDLLAPVYGWFTEGFNTPI
jgi:hypothetical protein